MNKIEILAPVGNMEVLEAAIQAGCDAIYCAMPDFGARAYAQNFTVEEMQRVIDRCHLLDIKVHVTMNTLLFESEMERAYNQAKLLHEMGVDALIVQDLGLIHLLHERLPNLVIHASTQLSITNPKQIEQLKKLGVKRVVLARECTKEQIAACVQTGMEIETFVHGAICICYSGQCLFSSLKYGRSGNRGMCAQPCRMPYTLYQDGTEVKTQGNYLLSPKDLSLIEQAKELQDLGICSIKIEGRMKSKEYVYEAVSKVKKVLEGGTLDQKDQKELKVVYNRGFSIGHYQDQRGYDLMNTKTCNHQGIPIGKVIANKKGRVWVRLNDRLNQNDGIRLEMHGCRVNYIYDAKDRLVSYGSPGEVISISFDKKVPVKTQVLKTTDFKLQKEVEQKVQDAARKIKVHCQLSCKGIGHPLVCQLSQKDLFVSVQSDELADRAKNCPTDEKTLIKQFSKTKDTCLEIDSFDFDLEGDFYFSLSALNHLRKKAVDAFFQEKTKEKEILEKPYDVHLAPVSLSEKLWVSEGMDSKRKDIADLRYNITNSYALACLLHLGFQGAILSLECKDQDVEDLMKAFCTRYGFRAPVMVYLYGKRRLMIMKHCVINTLCKDGKRRNCALCHTHTFVLQGKDGQKYRLMGDAHCHMCVFENEAYNALSKREVYQKMGVPGFAVFFLDEATVLKDKIMEDFKAPA